MTMSGGMKGVKVKSLKFRVEEKKEDYHRAAEGPQREQEKTVRTIHHRGRREHREERKKERKSKNDKKRFRGV